MEEYKEKIIKITKIIDKIENLLIKIKKDPDLYETLDKKDINVFFHMKDNFVFLNNLIQYFYNLYYMNSYEYLTNLNKLIDVKIDYLKKK